MRTLGSGSQIGHDMSMIRTTTDAEIRAALHTKRLRAIRQLPDTLVVDELGLAHAKVRIDIAVINGCVHGYEIKSSADTLERLPAQLALYKRCLGKLTVVCAPKHTERVMKSAPLWCGVVEAEKGPRGGIALSTIRRDRTNPNIELDQLAHLLWRGEAIELLSRHGTCQKILRQSRAQLYKHLAELMTIEQLTKSIREFMLARPDWRAPPAHA